MSDTIPPPWSDISLTGERMKPGYPFHISVEKKFPWFPVIAGVTGVGVATYFLTKENQDCDFTATLQTTSSSCELPNGAITVTVVPAGEYLYQWSNGLTNNSLQNITAGNYSVTITKAGTDCQQVLQVNVANMNTAFTANLISSDSDCGDDNGMASVDVNPAGSYTYMWSNGATGPVQNDLSPGEYTVTVSAGGICGEVYSVTINELPATFEVSINTAPSDCGNSNGYAVVTVDPPGSYTYDWSNANTGHQIINLPAGFYTVTVIQLGTECFKVITTEIEELPVDLNIVVTSTPSDCGQSNGSANIEVVHPPGSYNFLWADGNKTSEATGLSPGEYQVTVTIAGTSCAETTTVTITELPPSFVISSVTTPSGCNDSTGTANITIEPPGAYIITWSNGLNGPQVSGLGAGDYQVTVTISGTNCSNIATVLVGQSVVEFTGTISAETASCGVADGSATITIDPAGEYTYVWSDQQTGPVAQQLSAGVYSVTVTDANGCSSSFLATVEEDPTEYISIDNTIPGNCTGGGEINFTLTTPGMGPLVLQVVGPGGTGTFTLAEGSYSLSAFGNLPAGGYLLTVIDQVIGEICSEVVNVTIADNTPPLLAVDDFYTTQGEQEFIANTLDNDSGLMPEMTMVSNVFGGTVVFNNSGEFTFTPDPGFSGEATFNYTVTDACGNTATALVTITVGEIICDFHLDVTTTPASCGFEDGSIAVEVLEPGTYSFLWNTGDTDSVITNISAGTYSVTVEEVNLGCSLVFSIDLSENPADYIGDVIVTQPACGTDGEISFVASSPGMDPLTMSVDHPNGSDLFFIDEGPVFLSDYISILPGQYTFEVTDPVAGPDCVESFIVEINQPPASIEIAVEGVFPPSSPSAMDGSVFIVTLVQGELPYSGFLNGVSSFIAIEHNFSVGGLGTGTYTLQIMDVNGCFSNIVTFEIPFPEIILSFGTGIHSSAYVSEEENPEIQPLWNSGMYSSIRYYIGDKSQELQFFYAMQGDRNSRHAFPTDIFIVDHFSEIAKADWRKNQLTLQGGIGFTFLPRSQTDFGIDPQHWIIRGNASHKLGKAMQLQCSASLQGWKKIRKGIVDVNIRFTFGRFEPSTTARHKRVVVVGEGS